MNIFKKRSLDAVLVLGDRYELLGVATAAMNLRIPLIHLHGGETTEGAVDEAIRHSLTKDVLSSFYKLRRLQKAGYSIR